MNEPNEKQIWKVSSEQETYLSISLFTGFLVGAYFWSWLADAYGRTSTFKVSNVVTTIFAILAGFSWNLFMLCFCLGLVGFGASGDIIVNGTLFLEFTPPEERSFLILMAIFWPIGGVIAMGLGASFTMAESSPENAWR